MAHAPTPSPHRVPADRPTMSTTLQWLGFWGAVFAPLGYAPLLYGDVTGTQAGALAGLLALHVCCLVLGRGYGR